MWMECCKYIFELILGIDIFSNYPKIGPKWVTWDRIDVESTLVPVMAWCHSGKSHYLSQCWPKYMSSYGDTMPHRVKNALHWIIKSHYDVNSYALRLNFIITMASCHYGNMWGHHWQQIWHQDNSQFSSVKCATYCILATPVPHAALPLPALIVTLACSYGNINNHLLYFFTEINRYSFHQLTPVLCYQ